MDGKRKLSSLTKEELIELAKRQNANIDQLKAACDPATPAQSEQKVVKYEERIKELESQLAIALSGGTNEPRDANDEMKLAEMASLQGYIEQCEAQLHELRASSLTLEQKCIDLEKERDEALVQLGESQKPADAEVPEEVQLQLQGLQSKLADMEIEYQKALQDQRHSDERWLEAMSDADQKQGEVDMLQAEINELKKEAEWRGMELVRLQEDATIAKKEAGVAQEELAMIEAKCRELLSKNQALKKEISEPSYKPDPEKMELGTQVSEMTMQLMLATQDAEKFHSEVAEQQTQIDVLTNDLHIQRIQNKDLQQQLAAAVQERAEKDQAMASLQSSLNQLHADLQQSHQQVEQLEVSMQTLECQLNQERSAQAEEIQKFMAEHQDTLQELQMHCNEVEAKLADTVVKLTDRENDVTSLKAQLDTLQEELVEARAQLAQERLTQKQNLLEMKGLKDAHAAALSALQLQITVCNESKAATEATCAALKASLEEKTKELEMEKIYKEDANQRADKALSEKERIEERLEALERERTNERKAGMERTKRLDEEERSVKEQLYSMKQSVADKETTIQVLQKELEEKDRVSQRQVNELLEKEAALKDLSHQLATLKKDLAARDKKLNTIHSEKEGFAAIAGERDSTIQELQRAKGQLQSQLTKALEQVTAKQEEIRQLNQQAFTRADTFSSALLRLGREEALMRWEICAEEQQKVVASRETLFHRLLPLAIEASHTSTSSLDLSADASTNAELRQIALKQAGNIKVLESRCVQLETENKEAAQLAKTMEAKYHALSAERDTAMKKCRELETRAANLQRLLAEKMTELENLRSDAQRTTATEASQQPMSKESPKAISGGPPRPVLASTPAAVSTPPRQMGANVQTKLNEMFNQISSGPDQNETAQLDALLNKFKELPKKFQGSPPDHLEFQLHLTALLSDAEKKLFSIQLYHQLPAHMLDDIQKAVAGCLEDSPSLRSLCSTSTTPHKFVKNALAMLTDGSLKVASGPATPKAAPLGPNLFHEPAVSRLSAHAPAPVTVGPPVPAETAIPGSGVLSSNVANIADGHPTSAPPEQPPALTGSHWQSGPLPEEQRRASTHMGPVQSSPGSTSIPQQPSIMAPSQPNQLETQHPGTQATVPHPTGQPIAHQVTPNVYSHPPVTMDAPAISHARPAEPPSLPHQPPQTHPQPNVLQQPPSQRPPQPYQQPTGAPAQQTTPGEQHPGQQPNPQPSTPMAPSATPYGIQAQPVHHAPAHPQQPPQQVQQTQQSQQPYPYQQIQQKPHPPSTQSSISQQQQQQHHQHHHEQHPQRPQSHTQQTPIHQQPRLQQQSQPYQQQSIPHQQLPSYQQPVSQPQSQTYQQQQAPQQQSQPYQQQQAPQQQSQPYQQQPAPQQQPLPQLQPQPYQQQQAPQQSQAYQQQQSQHYQQQQPQPYHHQQQQQPYGTQPSQYLTAQQVPLQMTTASPSSAMAQPTWPPVQQVPNQPSGPLYQQASIPPQPQWSQSSYANPGPPQHGAMPFEQSGGPLPQYQQQYGAAPLSTPHSGGVPPGQYGGMPQTQQGYAPASYAVPGTGYTGQPPAMPPPGYYGS